MNMSSFSSSINGPHRARSTTKKDKRNSTMTREELCDWCVSTVRCCRRHWLFFSFRAQQSLDNGLSMDAISWPSASFFASQFLHWRASPTGWIGRINICSAISLSRWIASCKNSISWFATIGSVNFNHQVSQSAAAPFDKIDVAYSISLDIRSHFQYGPYAPPSLKQRRIFLLFTLSCFLHSCWCHHKPRTQCAIERCTQTMLSPHFIFGSNEDRCFDAYLECIQISRHPSIASIKVVISVRHLSVRWTRVGAPLSHYSCREKK